MKKPSDSDKIFAEQQEMIVDFVFDENVANVFPDMIRRSVPGYDSIVSLLGIFAERYVQANTNIYDLGCSLGAATLALRRRITQQGCRIIAVDNAKAMVEQCRDNIKQDDTTTPVEVMCDDIQNIVFENASLVIINFTLQFIKPGLRLELIKRIYQGLQAGGVLVIADKIAFESNEENGFQQDMHIQFKRANGYTDLEISQKRTALEKVLLPDTLVTHYQRLHEAGFKETHTWFQCFNFAGICAIK